MSQINKTMESKNFDFDNGLPSLSKIHERVAKRYNELTISNDDDTVSPLVCVICDELIISIHNYRGLNPKKLLEHRRMFEWKENEDVNRSVAIEDFYQFEVPANFSSPQLDFTGMALSPRAILRCKNYSRNKRQHHFSDYLITCCAVCQRIVHKDGKLPLYVIVNKNYVGCTPACLLSLTEIEVAMLTPIKCYGFCYSYIGGTQTNLRGTLTFMRTKQNSTAQALLQLDTMGLRNDVLVLAHGNMTPNQYENCKNKAKIRVDKVLLAVEWLVQNHLSWKTVILDDIRRDLEHTKPLFFDISKRCPAKMLMWRKLNCLRLIILTVLLQVKKAVLKLLKIFGHVLKN